LGNREKAFEFDVYRGGSGAVAVKAAVRAPLAIPPSRFGCASISSIAPSSASLSSAIPASRLPLHQYPLAYLAPLFHVSVHPSRCSKVPPFSTALSIP